MAIHLTGFPSIIDGFAAAMILGKPAEVLEDITDAGRSEQSRGMEAVSFMQMMLAAKEETG